MFSGIIKQAVNNKDTRGKDVVVKIRAHKKKLGALLELIKGIKKSPDIYRVYHHYKKGKKAKFIYGVKVNKIKNGIGYGLVKPKDQVGRFEGVSVGVDKNGFFCYTHRARSKSYPTLSKIPDSKIKFIESTG